MLKNFWETYGRGCGGIKKARKNPGFWEGLFFYCLVNVETNLESLSSPDNFKVVSVRLSMVY